MRFRLKHLNQLLVLLIFGGAYAQTVDVPMWVHQHPPLIAWLESKVEAFEAENPNVNIDLTAYPSPDMRTRVFTALSADQGPVVFDLFAADFPNVVSRNIAAPVDWTAMGYDSAEAYASEWFTSAISATEMDGQYYAIPYLGNAFSLFINTEHFREAGLDPETDAPTNWQELTDVARQLTVTENGRIQRKGFDLPFTQGPHWWGFVYVPMIRQYGGDILNAEGTEATLNSEAGVQALTVLYDLVHTHEVTQPGISTSDSVNPNQDFVDGNTSMWITGNWAIGAFPEDSPIRDQYAVVPMPQANPEDPHSILGGWWWYVSDAASEDQKREAWRFLNFIMAPGEQLAATGLLMPNTSIIESEQWQDFPYHDAFQEDLEAGEWPYMSVHYPEIETEVARAMERSLVNGMDPKESLDLAAENINRILNR